MFRILSLDGGGIRGVLTASLLERLERARPGFLGRVDLLAGTSTGGVLALGLAAGLTPAECRAMYEAHGAEVFADSLADDLRDLGNAVGAEYSTDPFRALLTRQFGDRTLNDLLPRRVLISAFDLDNDPAQPDRLRTWKPKFFHNFPGPDSDGAERIVDVALRTSAAPTYFPVYQGYIDGGVVAKSPSMCALAEALNPRRGAQRQEDLLLLSIGTGRNPRYLTTQDADWGWAQWARPLIGILIEEGNGGVADYQCRQLLAERYFYLNPALPEPIALDDIHQVPRLKEIAAQTDLDPSLAWLGAVDPADQKARGRWFGR